MNVVCWKIATTSKSRCCRLGFVHQLQLEGMLTFLTGDAQPWIFCNVVRTGKRSRLLVTKFQQTRRKPPRILWHLCYTLTTLTLSPGVDQVDLFATAQWIFVCTWTSWRPKVENTRGKSWWARRLCCWSFRRSLGKSARPHRTPRRKRAEMECWKELTPPILTPPEKEQSFISSLWMSDWDGYVLWDPTGLD